MESLRATGRKTPPEMGVLGVRWVWLKDAGGGNGNEYEGGRIVRS